MRGLLSLSLSLVIQPCLPRSIPPQRDYYRGGLNRSYIVIKLFTHLDYIIAYQKSNAKLNGKFVLFQAVLHYTIFLIRWYYINSEFFCPAACSVRSRAQQKSFLFLLEEKIRRVQIKKSEENFFVGWRASARGGGAERQFRSKKVRSEEHTSELQSR